MDESDVALPKATITKMIKEALPPDVRVQADAVDMILECCTEFVHLVSSEANEVSGKEKKATILPEHVLKALDELGFQQFTGDVRQTWEHYKQDAKQAPKLSNRKTMADEAGLTEAEQIALQKRLFAEAKARSTCSDPAAVQAVYDAAAAVTSQQAQAQAQYEQQAAQYEQQQAQYEQQQAQYEQQPAQYEQQQAQYEQQQLQLQQQQQQQQQQLEG